MKKVGGVICLFLSVVSFGSAPGSGSRVRTKPVEPSDRNEARRARLLARLQEAHQVLLSGRYLQAEKLYETACQEATATGQQEWAGGCLNNLGACRFALFRYREALDAFLEARKISEAVQDWANLANLNANISGLYYEMGDMDAAVRAAEQGLAALNRKEYSGARSKSLAHLASLRAEQGRMDDAARLIGESIDRAYQEGDVATVARAWDRIGEEYLKRSELPHADWALTEAFRIRKLHHLRNLDSSYVNLGKLRLAEGALRSASVLLDEAVARQKHPDSLVSLWTIYHARGRVRLAQGRYRQALADFRTALDLARRWRLEVLPADATRVSSEIGLQQIYSSFIDAGNRLYFAEGRRDLARETFQVAEENRAASLRALLTEPNDWRRRLPPEYWEALAQLQATEIALLRQDSPSVREKMERLRSAALEMEARAGSNPETDSAHLLEQTQGRLGPHTALLSFHLGDSESYLWAVSRDRFRVYRLARKPELAAAIAKFSDAVRTAAAAAGPLGQELYQELFGSLEPSFQQKSRWVLALDEQLFMVPFAALIVERRRAKPVYLAERHSIQITSGALMPVSSGFPPWPPLLSGCFLGIGDPIYNTADPRWKGARERTAGKRFFLLPAHWSTATSESGGPSLQMARLAGSAREIESCTRAWKAGAAILLEGADASLGRLAEALRTQPSVIHFATHFLEAKQSPKHGMIALSLSAGGEPEFLSPLEITRARVQAGLVVLSGCSSGRAEAWPGTGLMGLTRAWLAAGARAVAASHWPTPDDSGALFLRFYQHLREAPEQGPAVALERAQLDMLESATWRAQPRYWAAYFLQGNL